MIMKKFFTILFMLAIAIEGYSQDYLNFRNGSKKAVVLIEITPENIKYKDFDNQAGVIHTILKSDVVSVFYQNGREENLNSEYDYKKLTYIDGEVNLDGKNLSKREIKNLFKNTEALKYYSKSRTIRVLGMTSAYLGGACMGIGFSGLTTSSPSLEMTKGDILFYTVSGFIIAGSGIALTSLSPYFVKKAVNTYNQSLNKEVSLNIGFTRNGVGLTFNF